MDSYWEWRQATYNPVAGRAHAGGQHRLRAANGAGAAVEYIEIASARSQRPVWQRLLRECAPGDEVVVYKLDRAFRSVADAARTLEELHTRGVAFPLRHRGLEYGNSGGEVNVPRVEPVAEFEIALLGERVKAGMERAKANGKHVGRPRRKRE